MDDRALGGVIERTMQALRRARRDAGGTPEWREVGTVASIGEGIATVEGLPGAQAHELLRLNRSVSGMVFNLDPREIGVVLLDDDAALEAGHEVQRTGDVVTVPVGPSLVGRVVDALGRPLDERGPIRAVERRPVEREAPGIMSRARVDVPLQTGIKVIDTLIPIGRGQRELILGDRQTGKTAIARDTIINQRASGVVCVYCAIGKQNAAVARVIADLRKHQAMDYTLVVAAGAEATPGQQFIAPYAATSIGEYFMEQGRDVLIVYDDLTWHARAYRQLSLLLRRPPGREAYPGDIFYIHARLLERSTHLNEAHGGGSLTAMPIIETQAQNLSAYIPTNLISITDGQIYLSPVLFQRGMLPAVDVGRSVSRVGGSAQLPVYRDISGKVRLAYAQFQELEAFARFSTRLDEHTRQTLARGRRVREVLKQRETDPVSVGEQIALFLAVTEGLLDAVPVEDTTSAVDAIRAAVVREIPELTREFQDGARLNERARAALLETCRSAVPPIVQEKHDADDAEPETADR